MNMAKHPKKIPDFTAPGGRTLFVFEKGVFLIFGESSEAAIPVADLAAFLRHCDEEVSSSEHATLPERLGE